MNITVTGGAGFIGSNFVLHWIAQNKGRVIKLRRTVQWYLNNKAWMDEATSSSYQK